MNVNYKLAFDWMLKEKIAEYHNAITDNNPERTKKSIAYDLAALVHYIDVPLEIIEEYVDWRNKTFAFLKREIDKKEIFNLINKELGKIKS